MKLVVISLSIFFGFLLLVAATKSSKVDPHSLSDHLDHSSSADTTKFPFQKTEAEWKEILTPDQFRILRKKGTELPYLNEYNKNDKKGIYKCAACGQVLYSSEHKYESGSGWPSFWKPIDENYVVEQEDNSFFMSRVEIVCSNCGSHLGHVFDDGPNPTGLRYCMNSLALKFEETSGDK